MSQTKGITAVRILLRGGLGNQLFQILMGLELERRFGKEVLFSDLMLRESLASNKHLTWPNYSEVLGLAQHEAGNYVGGGLRLVASMVNILTPEEKNCSWLLSSRHEIRLGPEINAGWLDAPGSSSEIAEIDLAHLADLVSKNFAEPENPPTDFFAIHLRLGDFEQLRGTYGDLTSSYLPGVIKFLESHQKDFMRVILFSDEPFRAKQFLSAIYEGEVELASNFCSTTQQEFRLMMRSKAISISNSTFSWWAAKLGNPEFVMFPEPFRGPALRLPQYRIPCHWIGLEA